MVYRTSKIRAFTLVEVAVAVAILGVAFASLITLNTRFLSSYYDDRNLTHAALLGQRAMSMIEISSEPPPAGITRGKFIDLLTEGQDIYRRDEIERIVQGWEYELDVQSIPVPPLEDALRRIDLRISWGEKVEEGYDLVFFMKNQQAGALGAAAPF